VAEIVLAAGIEAQILAHTPAVGLEETHQAADMVEVAMTDDQRIDAADIDVHEFEVVGINVRREAEVEEIVARLLPLA
jgi:hypothetical protein